MAAATVAHAGLAALTALLLAAAAAADPAAAPAGPGAPDSLPTATADAVPAARIAPHPPEAEGFTVRRITNPRYRAPVAAAPGFGAPALGRLRSLAVAHLQVTSRGGGSAQGTRDWELSVGEESPAGSRIEASAAGGTGGGRTGLRSARVEARLGALELALGDAPPLRLLADRPPLHGLRGATVAFRRADGPRWSAAAGGATPVGPRPAPAIRILALAVAEVRHDIARLSAAASGFRRAAAVPGGGTFPVPGDTLAGGGGELSLGWAAPLGGGALSGGVTGQAHDLHGARAIAVQHAVAWRHVSSRLVAEVADRRGSPRLVRLSADRLLPDAGAETRWGLQSRHRGGRMEWHVGGVRWNGGGPARDATTVHLGGSSGLGRSAWQVGGDAVWERRLGAEQRRTSLRAGHYGARRVSLAARLEHLRRAGEPGRGLLAGDLLVPFRDGARLALQPRLAWAAGTLDRAGLAARATWPLARWSGQLTASLAADAERNGALRGRLSEAGLAFTWAPRARDRGALEVTRRAEGDRSWLDYGLVYDAQVERYGARAHRASADSGALVVRVVRETDGTGIADVLISLDGNELRFTDADGLVRFERVAPGTHLLAVEEASLPAHHQVAGAAREFAQVEEGRATPTIVFTVSRPERRRSF